MNGVRGWSTTTPRVPASGLAVGKKGGTATELSYEHAVEEAVRFNWIDSTMRPVDEHRFKQLFARGGPAAPGRARTRNASSDWSGLGFSSGRACGRRGRQADGCLEPARRHRQPRDARRFGRRSRRRAEGTRRLRCAAGLAGAGSRLYWIATAKRPETRVRRIEETVNAARKAGRPLSRTRLLFSSAHHCAGELRTGLRSQLLRDLDLVPSGSLKNRIL